MNEHSMIEPGTDVSVKRSPDLRARMETTAGAAAVVVVVVVGPVATSPAWNATAV